MEFYKFCNHQYQEKEPEIDLTLNELRTLGDMVTESIKSDRLLEVIHDIYLLGYSNGAAKKE